ncbi:unnamed protein product [Trichobilharzia szidati]|nr:unnamed protein product [Trichobilharzia szidati]
MNFSWHVYLSETGAEISPTNLFPHVTQSLGTLIKVGETLEVNFECFAEVSEEVNNHQSSWWPAEVVLVSGYLILLKWCTPEMNIRPPEVNTCSNSNSSLQAVTTSESKEKNKFWFDTKGSNWQCLRPMGWCLSKGIDWSPPKQLTPLKETHWQITDWAARLQNRSVSSVFFERHCLYAFETIRVGGYFECEHELDPTCVWPVKVLMNIGGRVLLSWFGISSKAQNSDNNNKNRKVNNFTLFYLHRRLHPLGYGKLYDLKYCPPPGYVLERAITNIDTFIRGACPATYNELSKSPLHEFKVGWKLEAVHPLKPYFVQPATVVKVFNSRYFLVELDDLRGNESKEELMKASDSSSTVQFIAYAGMPEIMPVNESQLKGILLSPPPGWPKNRYFTWINYLTYLSAHNDYIRRRRDIITQSNASTFQENSLSSSSSSLSKKATVNNTLHQCTNLSPEGIEQAITLNSLPICPSESIFKGIHAFDTVVQKHENSSSNSSTEQNFNNLNSSSSAKDCCQQQTKDSDTTNDKSDRNEANSSNRFLLGMKLEIVAPPECYMMPSESSSNTYEIGPPLCTATVTRVEYPHLLWLLPDIPYDDDQNNSNNNNNTNNENSQEDTDYNNYYYRRRPILMDARSTNLYPVGWSAFVGHPIISPNGYNINMKENCSQEEEEVPASSLLVEDNPSSVSPTEEIKDIFSIPRRPPPPLPKDIKAKHCDDEICPPIYINLGCYLGPFLCKSSLELIPRQFGPGSVSKVMQSVVTHLIRAAYKPVRVLRMFEADWATGVMSMFNGRNVSSSELLNAIIGLTDANSNNVRVLRPNLNNNNNNPAFQQFKKEAIEQCRSNMRIVAVSVRCPRRGIKISVPVEVCCRRRAVEEYCRQVSLVFEACPHLISFVPPSTSDEVKSAPNITGIDTDRLFLNKQTQITFENITSVTTHDCPSFCNVRLRSRYFDRLPGWKRRLTALRAFTDLPSTPDGDHSRSILGATIGGHVTRSAMALQNNNLNGGLTISRLETQSNSHNSANTKNLVRRGKRKYRNSSRSSAGRRSSERVMSNGLENTTNNNNSNNGPTGCKRRGRPKRVKTSAETSELVPSNCQTVSSSTSSSSSTHEFPNPTTTTPNFPICNTGTVNKSSQNVQIPTVSNPHNICQPSHSSSSSATAASSYCPALQTPIPNCSDRNGLEMVNTTAAAATAATTTRTDQLPLRNHNNNSNNSPVMEEDMNALFSNIPRIVLSSNPMFWTPVDLAAYLGNTDCREMWPWLAAEAVDGQAFMLLTLPVLHRLVGLRWSDAVRLARHVLSVKQAFLEQYSTHSHSNETYHQSDETR